MRAALGVARATRRARIPCARGYLDTCKAIRLMSVSSSQSESSLLSPLVISRVLSTKERYDSIDKQLSQSAIPAEQLMREHASLSPLIKQYNSWLSLQEHRRDLMDILQMEEMEEAAKGELEQNKDDLRQIEQKILNLLVPLDPLDFHNAIVEIRSGVGGDEAALFAADLLRMYERYATISRGWTIQVISSTPGSAGGYSEVIMQIRGRMSPKHAIDLTNEILSDSKDTQQIDTGPYGALRYEAGVHRVQRTPSTDSAGRVHTSTASVIVLPDIEDSSIDLDIDEKDVRVDIMRASGAGGQHVNKTSSAVRLTHFPTGIVVSMQDSRSQHQNRATAWLILRARLLDLRQREQQEKERSARNSQVRGADRSDKSRTYNYAQNRITDHRIGLHLHDLKGCMEGESLETIVQQLRQHHRDQQLANTTS